MVDYEVPSNKVIYEKHFQNSGSDQLIIEGEGGSWHICFKNENVSENICSHYDRGHMVFFSGKRQYFFRVKSK